MKLLKFYVLDSHTATREKINLIFLKLFLMLKLCENSGDFKNLLLEEENAVSKILTISKIVSQALIAPALSHIIKALETIQTSFLWNNTNPKIKHKTNGKNFRKGVLKMLIYEIK